MSWLDIFRVFVAWLIVAAIGIVSRVTTLAWRVRDYAEVLRTIVFAVFASQAAIEVIARVGQRHLTWRMPMAGVATVTALAGFLLSYKKE